MSEASAKSLGAQSVDAEDQPLPSSTSGSSRNSTSALNAGCDTSKSTVMGSLTSFVHSGLGPRNAPPALSTPVPPGDVGLSPCLDTELTPLASGFGART